MRVFLSNSLHELLYHLKQQLFFNQKTLFEPKIVVVPSRPIEQWIRLQIADSLNIAAGFQTMQLQEITRFFLQHTSQKKNILSATEWAVVLEEQILEICQEEKSDPLWAPLIYYLRDQKSLRRTALCEHLGTLFHRYVLYGGRSLVEWIANPQDWQDHLLARMAKKDFIPTLTNEEEVVFLSPPSVHFFGFSHFSPFHSSLFRKGPPVDVYHLSPCKEFWSDVKSDHESAVFFSKKRFSEEQRERWEELIEDRHPMLANMGKVGREFAKYIEEENFLTIESYEERTPTSYLTELQQEILTLQSVSQMVKREGDDSIQLHLASSRRREVEIVFHLISELLSTTSYLPKDILVMAPDIGAYTPFIQGIFSQTIPFRLLEIPMKKDKQVDGVFQLLDLESRRWSSVALMELFQLPLFYEKAGWDEKDLVKIGEWIEKGSIRWA